MVLSIAKEAIAGIKKIGNEDGMQIGEGTVFTANFGGARRVQKSTLHSEDEHIIAFDKAIGGHRGGVVNCPRLSNSPSQAVSAMYHEEYYAVFQDDRLPKRDRWYGERANGKRKRDPRFSYLGNTIEQRGSATVMHPMKTSFPLSTSHPSLLHAAEAENNIRNMSEWLLLNAFSPLPYCQTASIAAENIRNACNYAESLSIELPCRSLARELPKGATGIQQCKELHDDGNAAIIPGIWTSIRGDNNVVLRFLGTNMNICFTTTEERFCWFLGWVPHKTEMREGLERFSRQKRGKMEQVHRIHHSAFSIPQIEHFGLVLFSGRYMKKAVESFTV